MERDEVVLVIYNLFYLVDSLVNPVLHVQIFLLVLQIAVVPEWRVGGDICIVVIVFRLMLLQKMPAVFGIPTRSSDLHGVLIMAKPGPHSLENKWTGYTFHGGLF